MNHTAGGGDVLFCVISFEGTNRTDAEVYVAFENAGRQTGSPCPGISMTISLHR